MKNNNIICRSTINDPTSISPEHNIDEELVSCGNDHSLILSNNNEVYRVSQKIILNMANIFAQNLIRILFIGKFLTKILEVIIITF